MEERRRKRKKKKKRRRNRRIGSNSKEMKADLEKEDEEKWIS